MSTVLALVVAVARNPLSLRARHFAERESDSSKAFQVGTIGPESAAYELAVRLDGVVSQAVMSPTWTGAHDEVEAADLLRTRDELLARLEKIQARNERLRALDGRVDPANEPDLDRLQEEASAATRRVEQQVDEIQEQVRPFIEVDAQNTVAAERARVNDELREVAEPLAEDESWISDDPWERE